MNAGSPSRSAATFSAAVLASLHIWKQGSISRVDFPVGFSGDPPWGILKPRRSASQ